MRKFNLLWSFLLLIGILHAQSITITTKQAGTLHQQITSPEKIKELTVKGRINRPDLDWLNSHCPQLMNLNLEEATIEAWNDPEDEWMAFPANLFPSSFANNTVLQRLVLPVSVTQMGVSCLIRTTSLVSIVCKNATPASADEDYPFIFSEQTLSSATLYVPEGAIETFRQAIGWKFKTIKPLSEEGKTNPSEERYRLSADGTTLLQWLSQEKVIDFTTDPPLNNITAIAENAFGSPETGLPIEQITLPSTLKSIGQYAFGNCTQLRTIVLGNQLTHIGNGAFLGCEQLTAINLPDTLQSLGRGAFSGCCSLKKVVIPPSVKKIENSTFYDCFQLKELLLPSSLTEIGAMAFAHTALKELQLGQTLITVIGAEAFGECPYLSKVVFPKTLQSIENEVFLSCHQLRDSEGLQYVTTIGSKAFYETQLTTLSLTNATEIGAWAFAKTAIGELFFPENLQNIGASAFEGCTQLKKVVFSRSGKLPHSGRKAFKGCISLREVDLGNLPRVDDGSFFECSHLTSILWSSHLKTIASSAFYACHDLEEIIFPETLQEVEDWAFYNCNRLRKIVFGSSAEKIGQETFSNCLALQTTTLGQSITELGDWCFRNCPLLKELYVAATTPPTLGQKVFEGVNVQEVAFFVPKASIALYQSAEQWKEFLSIKPLGISIRDSQKTDFILNGDWLEVSEALWVELYDLNGNRMAQGTGKLRLPSQSVVYLLCWMDKARKSHTRLIKLQ